MNSTKTFNPVRSIHSQTIRIQPSSAEAHIGHLRISPRERCKKGQHPKGARAVAKELLFSYDHLWPLPTATPSVPYNIAFIDILLLPEGGTTPLFSCRYILISPFSSVAFFCLLEAVQRAADQRKFEGDRKIRNFCAKRTLLCRLLGSVSVPLPEPWSHS